MGQVYKAYDPSLKRYVALKILRSDEPELIERFLREARTQAQVQHEHVCKIHEVDEADGKPFISMQYIEGKTLRDASAYMPPEQARGDIHNLDRRTDVYALGATLYELLSGKPPFQGNTNADIVVKVLQDEPLPLRKLNPLVPEELQTIVMKCLEKDPERRYDTARALAEDLGRFLEGEPILAHPTSIYYRLYNKARKHKVMVIALAIAVVIGLIALGYGIYVTRQASKQAELSQQLGQQIEKIDNIMYRAHTLPLHDVRPEKNEVRAMIDGIKKLRESVSYARGPGSYAIGRGYLALNEYEDARANLEEAWRIGYQQPEVAYALSSALAALYRKELQDIDRIEYKEVRESRKKKIAEQYREPALGYLRQSQGITAVSPEFIEAQIAYYEKQYEYALKKARKAYTELPALYEARILEADIFKEMAKNKQLHGEYKNALDYFLKAQDSYRSAAEIGRSDAAVYIGLCDCACLLIELCAKETNSEWSKYYKDGVIACQQAVQVNMQNADALIMESTFYNQQADILLRFQYKDPTEYVLKTIELAQKAIEIKQGDARSYVNIGSALLTKARWNAYSGKIFSEEIKNAISNLQKATEINPNDEMAYFLQAGAYLMQSGQSSYEKAKQCYNRAIKINPYFNRAYNNLANFYAYNALDNSLSGENPQNNIEMAIQTAKKGLEINLNYRGYYHQIAITYMAKAYYELEHNISPIASIQYASKSNQKFASLAPHSNIYFCQCELDVIEARWLMKQNKDPGEAFERAEENLRKFIEENPQENMGIDIANLYRWKAEWKQMQKLTARKQIQKGLETLNKPVFYPRGDDTKNQALILAFKGTFYLLQAKEEISMMHKRKLLEQAQLNLEKALATYSDLAYRFKPSLESVKQMLEAKGRVAPSH